MFDDAAASASIVGHNASRRLDDVVADVVDRGDKLLAHGEFSSAVGQRSE
jgi:hypothetical protein